MKRRQLLKGLAATASLAPVYGMASSLIRNPKPSESKLDICIFSKHLQFLDYDATAETAAEIGFDGVDLAVRPKGHILPENVETDLPRAVEAIKKAGLKVPMMTTAITSAESPHAETILRTAADLGIRYYRMGYYRYEKGENVADRLDFFERQAMELAELNEEFDIQASYQNHAGARYVGAPIWDFGMILRNIDSPYMGCQYDIRHATVEGGQAWPLGLDYIFPYINTLVIKDFHWAKNDEGKWQIKNVPVGEGMVDFAQFFNLLKEREFSGPISVHVEYKFHDENEAVASMRKKAIKTMKQEVQALRSLLEAADL